MNQQNTGFVCAKCGSFTEGPSTGKHKCKERTMKYFSYGPEGDVNIHETKAEAIKFAEVALDYYRDFADDGWNEDVNNICWGEIKQHTVMFGRKEPDCNNCLMEKEDCECGEYEPAGVHDYICDYKLEDVEKELAQITNPQKDGE